MRKLIEQDLKDAIQSSAADNEDILFAMDFDLGIIDGDELIDSDPRCEQFLAKLIASCDDATLLQVRDFFNTDF